MGMAPLAAFLKEDGREVFGFDATPNSGIKASLEKLGIGVSDKIESGRFFDLMVISSALARRKNEILKLYPDAKIIRRGECWAKLCENRRLTAVVGSHGKSTVSAMIAHASLKLNLDCGFLIGAVPNDFPSELSGFRADVDQPVGLAHDLFVVLYDNNRVAGVAEPFENIDKAPGVARV